MEAQERGLPSSEFAALLRGYRLAAGLSQEALGERGRGPPIRVAPGRSQSVSIPQPSERSNTHASEQQLTVLFRRGRTEEAMTALEQRVLLDLRVGRDCYSLQHALGNLCGYLVALDRLAAARAVAREMFAVNIECDPTGNLVLYIYSIEHAALAISLEGDVRRGALLAGYTEAALTRLGWRREYTEDVTRARLDALLLECLAPDERCSLLARGAALSKADALTLASVD